MLLPLNTLLRTINQKAHINSFHRSRIQRNNERTYHKADPSHNDQGESSIIDLTLILCNQYNIGDKDSEGSYADFDQNTKHSIQKRNNRRTEHLLYFQTKHIDRRMAVLPSKQIYISISPTIQTIKTIFRTTATQSFDKRYNRVRPLHIYSLRLV